MDALAHDPSRDARRTRRLISIGGLVQGVGFRPFVYRLAETWGLTGWVANGPAGVTIDIEGEAAAVAGFLADLPRTAPPHSRIERLDILATPPVGHQAFTIRDSDAAGEPEALVAADLATCPACVAELFDPADRRCGYPFINCTDCGPRYTIIDGLPYDRPLTAMRAFPMCRRCAGEYSDPCDRRFHAQPNACPECGPHVWFSRPGAAGITAAALAVSGQSSAVAEAAQAISGGGIIAIKGLGGFHLACDATNGDAVARLRTAKRRPAKPFAVMVQDQKAARQICTVGPEEAAQLASPQAPIVILDRLPPAATAARPAIADSVAPGQLTLGIMLPYTPLQHLLLRAVGRPLVMTSGNISDEPLVADNAEALRDLAPVAAAGMLLHNRDIPHRCDDSVVRCVAGRQLTLRRARGLSPAPLPFAGAGGAVAGSDIIAFGGQEKAAFCLTRGRRAFLSHHIGELGSAKAVDFLRESLTHYRRLFAPRIGAIACDLHPDYASARLAAELARELREAGNQPPLIRVQHHHAHIAACLGEYGLDGPVIGVAYDGTGLGDDGTLWGGEILIADRRRYRRFAHLKPFPLPGGELAVRRPRRTAYGLLAVAEPSAHTTHARERVLGDIPDRERAAMDFQIARRLNTPQSSSVGRLFDAAAVVCGFRGECSYDAEAAIWLETLAGPPGPPDGLPYAGDFIGRDGLVDGGRLLSALAGDLAAGTPAATVARRFHATVAALTRELCQWARAATGLTNVCLGGGVFMNRRLLTGVLTELEAAGFMVFVPSQAPVNDGGLAYGQAVVAAASLGE